MVEIAHRQLSDLKKNPNHNSYDMLEKTVFIQAASSGFEYIHSFGESIIEIIFIGMHGPL